MKQTNLTDEQKLEMIARVSDVDANELDSMIDEKIAAQSADDDGDDGRVNVESVRSAVIDDVYTHVFGVSTDADADSGAGRGSRQNASTSTSTSTSAPVAGIKNTEAGRVDERAGSRTNDAPPATATDRGDHEDAPVAGLEATAERVNADVDGDHQHADADGALECDICNFEASSAAQARAHARTHADGLVNCPHDGCDATLPNRRVLKRHRVHKHKKGSLGAGVGNLESDVERGRERLNRGGGIVDLG